MVGTQFASGATTAQETVFVSVAPCRLVDTRPGNDLNIGPRATKLGAGEAQTFTAWDSADGDSTCEIPNTATAISTNTTAVAPTARTFVALFPADVSNPGTSNLNVPAGATPTPNAGDVHVLVDVNGYFQPSSSVGATGPQGPAGADGADGEDGPANCLSDALILAQRWDADPCAQSQFVSGVTPAGSLAVGGGKVYLGGGSDVSVFDADTGTVITTISGFDSVSDLVFGLDGNLLVLDFGGAPSGPGVTNGTLTVIDATTDTAIGTPIDLGQSRVREMAVGDGEIYIAAEGRVLIVDVGVGTVSAMTGLPGSFAGQYDQIVFTGTSVYAHDFFGSGGPGSEVPMVHVYNTVTQEYVVNIFTPGGVGFSDLAFSGEHVLAPEGAQIFRIDPNTNNYVAGNMFASNIASFGGNAFNLAYDGKFLYATTDTDSYVTIDPTSATNLEAAGAVSLPDSGTMFEGPDQITFDGSNIWTYDPETGTVVKTLPQ